MRPSSYSRRDWLVRSCALLSASALDFRQIDDRATAPANLVANLRGGYRFLPGAPFLSFGAIADEGFEIVRTRLRQPRSLIVGLQEIGRRLAEAGRPIHALCGLELRSPRVPTPPEFAAFNQMYMERFAGMGLLVDGRSPVTRTNVVSAVPEPSIYAYSHTVPLTRREDARPSFVLSAMPEVRNLASAAVGAEPPDFVASADTTAGGALTLDGLRRKTDFILTALDETLRKLGVGWADTTGVQFYSLENAHPLLESLILPRIGAAARSGIEWHHAHPPGLLNLVEIDVRGIRVELTI